MTILITGAGGFIGNNFCQKLADREPKSKIICIDNINNYYSTKIKKLRIKRILKYKNVKFFRIDITDQIKLENLFKKYKFYKFIILLLKRELDTQKKTQTLIPSQTWKDLLI